jgi:hypothetical protein
MNPLKRSSVSKHKSAKHFRTHAHHTKGANMAPPPMRGGYRL